MIQDRVLWRFAAALLGFSLGRFLIGLATGDAALAFRGMMHLILFGPIDVWIAISAMKRSGEWQ